MSEEKAALDKIRAMERKAHELTDEERMFIMDMGFYNEVVKGYLVRAMKNAEFDREAITKALGGLRWAFDDLTASEAAEEYRKF